MKQLLYFTALACIILTVTALKRRRPFNRNYVIFFEADGDIKGEACREGIFRSKTKDLPTEYRASAQGIFNTMEDMIGYNTFATQLGADNLVRYDELYRELWTTIIRGHFQQVTEGMDPRTLEEAQLLRDEVIDYLEDYSTDTKLNLENYYYELALLVRKVIFDEEVSKLNSTDQERVNNIFEEIVSLSGNRDICLLLDGEQRTLTSLIQTLKAIFGEEPPEYPNCSNGFNRSEPLGGVVGRLLGHI